MQNSCDMLAHREFCLECLTLGCQDSLTNSHFNVIDGHGPAAEDKPKSRDGGFLRSAAFHGVSGLLQRDLHRMLVPSAHTSAALSEATSRRKRGTTCLYSRARTSVMRSRRGADAENIHHARGALSRPVDLRFIITFSPAPRDRRPEHRPAPYLEMRSATPSRSGVYAPGN